MKKLLHFASLVAVKENSGTTVATGYLVDCDKKEIVIMPNNYQDAAESLISITDSQIKYLDQCSVEDLSKAFYLNFDKVTCSIFSTETHFFDVIEDVVLPDGIYYQPFKNNPFTYYGNFEYNLPELKSVCIESIGSENVYMNWHGLPMVCKCPNFKQNPQLGIFNLKKVEGSDLLELEPVKSFEKKLIELRQSMLLSA